MSNKILPDYNVELIDLPISSKEYTQVGIPKYKPIINFNEDGLGFKKFNYDKYISKNPYQNLIDSLEPSYDAFMKQWVNIITSLYDPKVDLNGIPIDSTVLRSIFELFVDCMSGKVKNKFYSDNLLLFLINISSIKTIQPLFEYEENNYKRIYNNISKDENNITIIFDPLRIYLDDNGEFNPSFYNYNSVNLLKRNMFLSNDDYEFTVNFINKYNEKIVNSVNLFTNIIYHIFDNHTIKRGIRNVTISNIYNNDTKDFIKDYLLYLLYKSIYKMRDVNKPIFYK